MGKLGNPPGGGGGRLPAPPGGMLGIFGMGGGKPPWGGVPEALGGKGGGKGIPRPPGGTVGLMRLVRDIRNSDAFGNC